MACKVGAQEGESRFDEVHGGEEGGFELGADEVLGCGVGGEFFYCSYDG